ncbi:unnamed protein product, partial [Clonostachys byssicola]
CNFNDAAGSKFQPRQQHRMSPRIAIVGAGLCGLTISRLLECRGIEFALFEKGEEDKHLQCGGGSVDIYKDTGQRALREANLLDEFLKFAKLGDDKLAIYDRHGKKWAEVGGDDEHLGQGPPQIDQLVLKRMLLQSLPKEKIHWGHRVSSVELGAKGKPILKFADGSTGAGFDLVVGADGIWSRVRESIISCKPRYSGRYFIESRVGPNDAMYQYIMTEFGTNDTAILDGAKQVIIQRLGDGSFRLYLGISVPEDFLLVSPDLTELSNIRRLLLSQEFFGGWDMKLKNVIEKCEKFHIRPLYYFPPDALGWDSVPGLTLAGDAAHASTPYMNEGVNCAMVDAITLVSKIASYEVEGLFQAVRKYEEAMFVRGRDLITESQKQGELMSHEDGPNAYLQAIQLGAMEGDGPAGFHRQVVYC